MKKIITGLLSLSFIATGACLSGCKKPEEPKDPETPKSVAEGYVSLDINPSIELVVDQYGKVMSVYGSNDDARVLLYNETGIVGKTIEEAVAKITTLAKNLGYLDASNDVVGIISEGLSQDKVNSIKSTITTTASNLGLTVTTDQSGAYALYREFDEFKSKYPTNEDIQNLALSKFKLALSVSETSNTSLEMLVELDDSELVKMLNTNISRIETYMTEEFKNARNIAQMTYEQAKLFSNDVAYIYWFNQHIEDNPTESYLGAMYMLYHATGKGLDLIADTVEKNVLVKNQALSEDKINELVTALNLDNSTLLENANGVVTIDSVENYLDKVIQDSPNADFSTLKSEVDTILDGAELEIQNIITVAKDAYNEQLLTIFEKTTLALDSLETICETLNNNEETKELASEIEDRIEIYNDMVATLKTFASNPTGILNLEDLRTISDNLLAVADELKTDMDSSLTDIEKKQIQVIQETTLAQLSSALLLLESTIEDAETSAKAVLAELKNNRLSQ